MQQQVADKASILLQLGLCSLLHRRISFIYCMATNSTHTMKTTPDSRVPATNPGEREESREVLRGVSGFRFRGGVTGLWSAILLILFFIKETLMK